MKINASTQISSKMVLKEGILSNNDILNFEEIKIFMKERLNETVLVSLYSKLNQIEGCIKQHKHKEAYKEWENLERDILLNKDYAVSLLFINNIQTEDKSYNYTYSYSSKEYDVLSNRGKLTRLKQLSEKLFKENIEEQISFHLNQFLTDINSKNTRYKFIKELFQSEDSDIKRNAANARWHTKDWTYRNILYGNNPQWQGNATDAFINHLGHLHAQIFAADYESDNKNLFAVSVFNEEKENLWNLLYASKNNTPWYTGGDIIIKYGNELYNIQLKTGQSTLEKRRSRIGGDLATKQLLNLISELKDEIKNKDIEKLIQKLYFELKTSGWIEDTNLAVNNIANNLVKNNLTK